MLPANPIKRTLYRAITSLISSFAAILLSIYQSTLEFIIEGEDHLRILRTLRKNHIVAIWHTFVDGAVFCLHHRNLCIYSDHPRTKEYEQSVTHFVREIGLKTLRALGFDVLDASLGKQSAGIMNFIKKIQTGTPALIAPDGPSGPIYEAKPGVIYMAAKANSCIVPIGVGFSRRIVSSNWDDLSFPLPFSRVAFVVGEPIIPTSDLSEDSLAKQAKELEDTLDRLCFRANEILYGKKI
ncbi:lysophospholipid acyltransferase family protein [Leptospira sp. GIMC2001]|uniref:lysophospholipid acyltransferase family protein n=1 Tax=Leptospira sp. GIMC2001 TaxID=1513297 RepID=UPI0023499319|nr:hypothetical protein [Leptospira sp. GIMC2001]WCL50896.1 hypothetical protein O4O04_08815 [Leptospira sp. GIMC2001]